MQGYGDQISRMPLPDVTMIRNLLDRLVKRSGTLGYPPHSSVDSEKRNKINNVIDEWRLWEYREWLTSSTAPTAFHAHAFVGAYRAPPVFSFPTSPPVSPPSPSIVRFATTSTRSHSRSSAKPSANRLAASPSRASSSNAFWKHLDARVVSGGEAYSE